MLDLGKLRQVVLVHRIKRERCPFDIRLDANDLKSLCHESPGENKQERIETRTLHAVLYLWPRPRYCDEKNEDARTSTCSIPRYSDKHASHESLTGVRLFR